MNNQNRNENETREIKDKGNNSENPWKTDTRSNQVRFTQTFQKGHWAKLNLKSLDIIQKKIRMEK